MSDAPVITCAIPTLNGAATLEWTLLSLRNQQEVDVKIIVVDSGSTDDTLAICHRWNIETRFAERGNMYRAVNEGLRDAQTQWITYLNSDDLVYPTTYRDLLALAEREKADVAYGDFDFIDAEGRYLYSLQMADPSSLDALFRIPLQGLPQPGTIFTRALFEKLGGFSTDYRLISDADFFFRALRAGAKFVRLPKPVCAFRMHANQQTVTRAAEMRAEALRLREAAGGRTPRTWMSLAGWRLRNFPNYALRFLRTRTR
ncbi:MAG: glycosyltransferase [Thermoanaerobaculia bacterium]